jgi:hypothetical protein
MPSAILWPPPVGTYVAHRGHLARVHRCAGRDNVALLLDNGEVWDRSLFEGSTARLCVEEFTEGHGRLILGAVWTDMTESFWRTALDEAQRAAFWTQLADAQAKGHRGEVRIWWQRDGAGLRLGWSAPPVE